MNDPAIRSSRGRQAEGPHIASGCVDRARDFALASLLSSYPDGSVEQTLSELAGSLEAHPGAAGVVRRLRERGGPDDLRSAYIELFDRGGARASLYETEYGRMRGMGKGHDLADIAGFYRAFGLAMDPSAAHEMPDHMAVELEFYAVLLTKQALLAETGDVEGTEIVRDARRKFLESHLGRLAPAIAGRADVGADAAYGGVFAWCRALVEDECAELGVSPAPLDFFADEEAKKDMTCGTVHLPVCP